MGQFLEKGGMGMKIPTNPDFFQGNVISLITNTKHAKKFTQLTKMIYKLQGYLWNQEMKQNQIIE